MFLGVPWSGHCWLSSLWSALPGIPDSVVFAHWWNWVFLQLLRLPTFEDNKFLLLESVLVISLWLEHCGSWDGLAVMAAPLLFLTSGSSYSFSCFALERETRNLMDDPVPEVGKPLWCITSTEGKNCQVLSIPGLRSFFLSTKGCCVHWMIDLLLGCLSIAVIQGDEGGLTHMWPLAQGMHSVFTGLSAHPTPSSQELSSEVRSGFKVPSTDSSTCLTNSLAHLRHV